jgi:hypothetical protein
LEDSLSCGLRKTGSEQSEGTFRVRCPCFITASAENGKLQLNQIGPRPHRMDLDDEGLDQAPDLLCHSVPTGFCVRNKEVYESVVYNGVFLFVVIPAKAEFQ